MASLWGKANILVLAGERKIQGTKKYTVSKGTPRGAKTESMSLTTLQFQMSFRGPA